MPKMIILIKKKKGMSREDFIYHYEHNHAVMGKHLFSHLVTKYVRNYTKSLMEYQPDKYLAEDSYDVFTEIWFKDEAAVAEFNRIITLPENNKWFLEDEKLFQEPAFTRLLMVDVVDNGTSLPEGTTLMDGSPLPPQ